MGIVRGGSNVLIVPEYLFWILALGNMALGFTAGWIIRGVYEKEKRRSCKG